MQTFEQRKRLDDKDVQRNLKRSETCVSVKANETLIESFPSLTTKALGAVVRVKEADAV